MNKQQLILNLIYIFVIFLTGMIAGIISGNNIPKGLVFVLGASVGLTLLAVSYLLKENDK